MEKLLEEALPQVTQTELPEPPVLPEPPNNTLRNGGVVVGVIVLAAILAKLYNCTAKK